MNKTPSHRTDHIGCNIMTTCWMKLMSDSMKYVYGHTAHIKLEFN